MRHGYSNREPTARSRSLKLIAIASAVTLLLACAIPITYYDVTTYKNLTDLKVDMTALVATFDSVPLANSEAPIVTTRTAFLRAYEYEKGKGSADTFTVGQFGNILKLFDMRVADYTTTKPGALGKTYFADAAAQLGKAFDLAIATESIKNRDKN